MSTRAAIFIFAIGLMGQMGLMAQDPMPPTNTPVFVVSANKVTHVLAWDTISNGVVVCWRPATNGPVNAALELCDGLGNFGSWAARYVRSDTNDYDTNGAPLHPGRMFQIYTNGFDLLCVDCIAQGTNYALQETCDFAHWQQVAWWNGVTPFYTYLNAMDVPMRFFRVANGCTLKFNNFKNFGGFVDVPQENLTLEGINTSNAMGGKKA